MDKTCKLEGQPCHYQRWNWSHRVRPLVLERKERGTFSVCDFSAVYPLFLYVRAGRMHTFVCELWTAWDIPAPLAFFGSVRQLNLLGEVARVHYPILVSVIVISIQLYRVSPWRCIRPHRSGLSTLAFRSHAEHPADDFALLQRRLRAPMREIPSMRWGAEFKNGSVGVRDDGWVDSHHDGGHH